MLVPFNRHLLVEPVAIQESRGEAMVLIPESSVSKPTYSLFRLQAVSSDCQEKFHEHVGGTLLVNTNMVEEVTVGQEKFNLVLENHVVGIYNNSLKTNSEE